MLQTTKPLKPQNAKIKNTSQPTKTNQTSNKTPKQKTPFCHDKSQPLFFINSLFFNIYFLIATAVLC